ncbi:MAG: hypothetical protein AB2693_17465 [Candidatus Thiodiazotropha sp.]
MGQSAEPDVAETGAVYLFEIFKSVERVGHTETMKLRSFFGPFPASAATKACSIVNRITSWLPEDVIELPSNQVREDADAAATGHEFGRGIKGVLPAVENISDVSSCVSEEERKEYSMKYSGPTGLHTFSLLSTTDRKAVTGIFFYIYSCKRMV